MLYRYRVHSFKEFFAPSMAEYVAPLLHKRQLTAMQEHRAEEDNDREVFGADYALQSGSRRGPQYRN
jgi:hypothetical protein